MKSLSYFWVLQSVRYLYLSERKKDDKGLHWWIKKKSGRQCCISKWEKGIIRSMKMFYIVVYLSQCHLEEKMEIGPRLWRNLDKILGYSNF